MYTQCPECQTAFRVTAEVLQKAKGRVRCGGCGNAFSALDFLSEEMPKARAAKPAAAAMQAQSPSHDRKAAELAERSRALLDSLNELAGDEDVRIEDTGVEWRVLDENDVEDANGEDVDDPDMRIAETGSLRWFVSDDDNDGAETRYKESAIMEQLAETAAADAGTNDVADPLGQASLDLSHDTSASGERRYDDNTPLPEDFDDEQDVPYTPPPQRRASDQVPADTDFDKFQVDLELGNDEDWEDLLDEAEAVASRASEDSAVEEMILSHADQPNTDDEARESEEIVLEAEDGDTSGAIPELAVETAINPPDAGSATADRETDPADSDSGPVLADIDTQFNLQALALGIDTGRHEKLELADDEETLNNEMTIDFADDVVDEQEADEKDSGIIEKLRESTGAFQKQIAAAQLALERGDTDDDAPEAGNAGLAAGESASSDDEVTVAPAELADREADTEEESAADESTGESIDQPVEAPQAEEADDEPAGPAELTLAADANDDETIDTGVEAAIDDTTADAGAAGDEDEEPVAEALTLPPAAEQASINDEIDRELPDTAEMSAEEILSQTMIRAGIDPAALHSDNVESIVMEGEFVRGSLDKERLAAESEVIATFDDPGSLADTYMLNKDRGRRKSDPVGISVIVAIVVLAMLLVAQYVHSSRESLAAYGAFNQTLGPVYRALGNPITPEWDVKGWQFETTRGSTSDEGGLLTIFSRISNASDEPLPYPLVHVSLTDRWEEIIGSKVLEPADYLAGELDPRKPVAPGDRFSAVIAIDSPSPEATGFKLNVCYRVSPGRVRCATEDFKD